MRLAGIDLAWNIEKNNSAMAVGELIGEELSISDLFSNLKGSDQIISKIDSRIEGIAIDAPLIIKNQSGQRQCERELSSKYGSRGAACHASNLNLYKNSSSVEFSKIIEPRFKHLGNPENENFQIEVYPHPAIIEIFGLDYRLPYKKGKITEKRQGQIKLADSIKSLKSSRILKLNLNDSMDDLLEERRILTLQGKSLKMNEDALDSIICLYVCALYVKDESRQDHAFGFKSFNDGYIYVPRVDRHK